MIGVLPLMYRSSEFGWQHYEQNTHSDQLLS